jgi:hypothetical protein
MTVERVGGGSKSGGAGVGRSGGEEKGGSTAPHGIVELCAPPPRLHATMHINILRPSIDRDTHSSLLSLLLILPNGGLVLLSMNGEIRQVQPCLVPIVVENSPSPGRRALSLGKGDWRVF